jgi:hypothetical protein
MAVDPPMELALPQASPGFAPSVTVSRRAPIELNLPLMAPGTRVGSADEMLLDSPLDVPAFLRRQN